MKALFSLLATATLLFLSCRSFAEAPELLVPVTGHEAAAVEAKNPYFLKKHLYFAKRYRIVRVRTDLLLNEERLKILLFDGKSVIFEVTKLKITGTQRAINWSGRLTDPPVSPEDILEQNPELGSIEAAERMHRAFFDIFVSATRYDYDAVSGLYYPSLVGQPPFLYCDKAAQSPELPASSVHGAYMRISIPTMGAEYSLRSLEMSPEHHLFIEIDEAEVVTPGPAFDPERPELAQKRRERAAFLRELGEDPRTTAMEALLERKRCK